MERKAEVERLLKLEIEYAEVFVTNAITGWERERAKGRLSAFERALRIVQERG